MPVQLSIVEKIVGQPQKQAFSLSLVSERVPARDILASHVRAEVDRLNEDLARTRERHNRVASMFVGAHIHETEQRLNPGGRHRPKPLDAEAEVADALGAVEARQIIMLFDDREVTDLDADLTVTDQSSVTFLRLVPLIGG